MSEPRRNMLLQRCLRYSEIVNKLLSRDSLKKKIIITYFPFNGHMLDFSNHLVFLNSDPLLQSTESSHFHLSPLSQPPSVERGKETSLIASVCKKKILCNIWQIFHQIKIQNQTEQV